MILQNPLGKWIVPLHSRKINPRQKSLIKIGCAALALTLTVGTVPFLMSHAAEGAAVSDSDIVAKNDVVSPADASAGNGATVFVGTAAPKRNFAYEEGGITCTFEDGVLTFTGTGTLTEDNVNHALDAYTIPSDQSNVTSIVIGGNIDTIGESAFSSFMRKRGDNISLTVGGSVQTISTGAFKEFFRLSSVQFGDNVTSIGSNAFYKCDKLTSIQFGSGLTTIGSYAFSTCSALRSVSIPDSVTTIKDHAFHNCFSLSSISFGEGLTSIGGYAVYDCRGVRAVTIPKNVRNIDNYAFYFYTSETPTRTVTIEAPCFDTCHMFSQFSGFGGEGATVILPCEHFKVGGTVVTDENSADYFGKASIAFAEPDTELRNVTKATCTEKGYSGDTYCKVCGDLLESGEETDPLGHDMGEWNDDDPVQERVCKRDGTYKEYRLNPAIKFAVTSGDHSQYTLGSQKTLGLTIDRVDREDKNVYTYFTNGGQVVVTGTNDYSKTLTSDDFDAESGSLKITLKVAYLEGLTPGTYSLTASFKVADGYDPIVSEPVSFTIVKPSGGSSSPATGESGMMTTFCMALMLIAAYGAVYALKRRKTENAG